MAIREKLAKRAKRAGLTLTSDQFSALAAYFELLARWNRKLSLTSLDVQTPADEAVDRLLIEPLLAAQFLPSSDSAIIDIGSGGGSPAIPMRLASPRSSLTMVESKARKAAFLREAVRQLELPRTTVQAARFEDLSRRPEYDGSADVLTVRAVRVERPVLAGFRALVRPGGILMLFRSGSLESGLDVVAPGLLAAGEYGLLNHLQTKLTILRRA